MSGVQTGTLWRHISLVGPLSVRESVCVCTCTHTCTHMLSHVQLFVTLRSLAHQASLSRGFSRQEYRSEWPSLLSGRLPNQGIKLTSLVSPADSLPPRPLSGEHKTNRPLAFRSHLGEDLEDGCALCSHPETPEYQVASLNSLKAP